MRIKPHDTVFAFSDFDSETRIIVTIPHSFLTQAETDLLAHEMQAAVRVILPDASSEYPDVTLTPQQRKPILRAVNNHK